MSQVFNIYRGDTRLPFGFALQRPNGEVVDLTGTVVKFAMYDRATGAVKVNESAATITSAVNGEGEYRWAASDVNAKGKYNAYVVVVDANGKKEHFPPALGDLIVHVHGDGAD